MALSLPACQHEKDEAHHEHHKIVVTTPMVKDVTITQPYVCQIRSQRHIEIRGLEEGYLQKIPVREGQYVKAGDELFRVVDTLYKSKLDAELAEARLAQLELNNTKKLFEQKVVSSQEVALFEAKLARAQAKASQAEAELNFTVVRAPFDGIIDRLQQQQGSLIKKEDLLTTLSDNTVMWVYFNVPECRYLEYMADLSDNRFQVSEVSVGKKKKKSGKDDDDDDEDDDDDKSSNKKHSRKESRKIELVLANGAKFPYSGKIGAIEAKFNNETGSIPFRADFPNPNGLLRHGQTGNILIHKIQKNAIVIPQRATFEILDRRYVFVVDKDSVVHQREIGIEHELDDIFVVKSGLNPSDKIILEGVRQVHDGDKLDDVESVKAEEALANQKHHAE